MDILNLPNDYFECSSSLFLYSAEARMKASTEFIQNEYDRKDLLYKTTDFVQHDFCDMLKADFSHMERIGNFPIREAFYELQHSINHALIGSYKAAFADLRRSMEMCLTIPFFTKENMEKYVLDESMSIEDRLNIFDAINEGEIKEANDWIKGERSTPFFSNMLKKLVKEERFKEIDEECKWKEKIQGLYFKISDFSHNKGYRASYEALNSPSNIINSIAYPTMKKESLKLFCDLYIETVQNNSVILALYNPLVLEGLPIEQKFGINEPFSGYFCHAQSELLWELLPQEYHAFFEKIRTTDMEVLDAVQWVMDRPDVSDEEFTQQIIDFNLLIDSLSKKTEAR